MHRLTPVDHDQLYFFLMLTAVHRKINTTSSYSIVFVQHFGKYMFVVVVCRVR